MGHFYDTGIKPQDWEGKKQQPKQWMGQGGTKESPAFPKSALPPEVLIKVNQGESVLSC